MIGSNIGSTYLFGEESPSFNNFNNKVTGANVPFDDMVGQALEGIEVTDNMTEEYYAQWSKAKSLAKTAWSNYGIDVTSPDINDPEQMRLHNLFLKSVASVKSMGNTLKRGAQFEDLGVKASITNPNIVDMGRSREYTDSNRFVNTGFTEGDEAIYKRVGRSVDSISERDALNKERNDYIGSLVSEVKTTTDPNRKRQLIERIESLKNVSATYNPSRDRDRMRLINYDRKRTKGKEKELDNALDLWKQTQIGFESGDRETLEILEQIKGVNNVKYVTKQDEAGNMYPSLDLVISGSRKGEEEVISINLNDNEEGYKSYLSVLQKLEGYKNLDIDKASIPEEERLGASSDDYFNYVDSLKKKLTTKGSSFWKSGDRENPYISEINDSINNSIDNGMFLPKRFGGKSDIDEDSRVVNVDFGTTFFKGKPYMDITFIDANGVEKKEEVIATKENVSKFLEYNAAQLYRSNKQDQKSIPSTNIGAPYLPETVINIKGEDYTLEELGWTEDQYNQFLNR